jgi:hypothetical protein
MDGARVLLQFLFGINSMAPPTRGLDCDGSFAMRSMGGRSSTGYDKSKIL